MATILPTSRSITNWGAILWRERRFCGDKDYAKHLRRTYLTDPASWFYRLTLRHLGRPYAAEVEAALRSACDTHRGIRYYWQDRLNRLDRAKERTLPISKLTANLQDDHWLERFIARHVLLYRGGEAVVHLRGLVLTGSPAEAALATWLILSIGEETRERLANDAEQLLCSDCFVHCHPLEIDAPEKGSVTYYGCRACHQSITFQPWPDGGVVAVLDRKIPPDVVQANNQIRVNWIVRRRLFDFNQVEIIYATDEEVERFAVQVGNDTEEWRNERYGKMICRVSSDCHLSPGTMRILADTFGKVYKKS
ncbi:MAG: hypothetical protein H6631_04965 [Anaerolineaceae bacterium]|nr:hypothetical protein [Anaerolineaceae bacterium]MCB9101264.1 hypothetical protein [Anaerolineales bacterium]